MSNYKQREGDIAIFRVAEKKNERGPDWTGKALVNGQEMEIAVWAKTATMFAGTIRPKKAKETAKAKTDQVYAPRNELDSEIPF